MRIGALQNGVETASLHVAPETLRCTDGWLTISDQLEFVGDPRRTDNDEEIISVRVTRDGALILRKIYTVFPGDKVLTSYERFRRLH
jgi:hypothetical protein